MRRDSLRYNVLKLEELIKSYINSKENSAAKTELTNIVLEGEDLTDVLDNIGFETEKETKENNKLRANYEEKCKEYDELEKKYKELEGRYNKLKENYNENLSQDIKRLIEGKEGPFIDKINKILKE